MFTRLWNERSRLLLLGILIHFAVCTGEVNGQVEPCPDPAPQSSGTYRFKRAGDVFELPIKAGDCPALSLDLRWSNGANNGSNFVVTFFDDTNQPIHSRLMWGFMTGSQHFSFTALEWLGTASMMAVPVTATVQAVEPFAFPSSISYRITRVSRQPKSTVAVLDHNVAMALRLAPGKLLTEGVTSSFTYRLDEVGFDTPREVERFGKKEIIERAFRLTLKSDDLSKVGLVWIDDVTLPAYLSGDRQSVVALIYDSSILKDGAQVLASESDCGHLRWVGQLKLPASFRPTAARPTEEGNSIVSLKTAIRSIGSSRHPLVQLELRTSRPFPARPSPLQLQVGKRFFLNELSGDYTGRSLTLTLTPEMFAEVKDGSEIVAFFDRPDRSGFTTQDVWYFGRLNKSQLDK
jgi:hypothetical protein